MIEDIDSIIPMEATTEEDAFLWYLNGELADKK